MRSRLIRQDPWVCFPFVEISATEGFLGDFDGRALFVSAVGYHDDVLRAEELMLAQEVLDAVGSTPSATNKSFTVCDGTMPVRRNAGRHYGRHQTLLVILHSPAVKFSVFFLHYPGIGVPFRQAPRRRRGGS